MNWCDVANESYETNLELGHYRAITGNPCLLYLLQVH